MSLIRSSSFIRLFPLVAIALLPALSRAEIKLPRILGDNMVLQREMPVRIWGTGDPGEEVTVSFAGQSVKAKAAADGNWLATLAPLTASASPAELTVSGSSTVARKNILVGEVWLASGQSNMEMPLLQRGEIIGHPDPAKVLAGIEDPLLRFIMVPKQQDTKPRWDVAADWHEATSATLANPNGANSNNGRTWVGFSSAAYFFAKRIKSELGVPVGIVQSTWGGQRIEPFTPVEGYRAVAGYNDYVAAMLQNPPASIEGERPGRLYNAMIAPLVPMTFRGALWYQGESNLIAANETTRYTEKMQALVTGWREVFRNPDMPFFYVQLAPYEYAKRPDRAQHSEQQLPAFREAQYNAMSKISDSGMIVTTDLVNDLADIHPHDKWTVGDRLANWALAKTYGKPRTVYSGPVYKAMQVEGTTAALSFDHLGSGLASRDGAALTGFLIAGDDRIFRPAQARIEGQRVLVSAPQVNKPAAVRFAWTETSQPNLMNKEGLPAVPFRTDFWDTGAILQGYVPAPAAMPAAR